MYEVSDRDIASDGGAVSGEKEINLGLSGSQVARSGSTSNPNSKTEWEEESMVEGLAGDSSIKKPPNKHCEGGEQGSGSCYFH